MPPRLLSSLLLLLGFAGPAPARDLFVELDILQLNGPVPAAELITLLASPQLRIEAHYQPTRLIEGSTARRERTLPIGSKLFAVGQQSHLSGAQIQRKGLALSFQVSEGHPAHTSYRLQSLILRTPLAAGPGRPQPDLEITLLDELPVSGAHEIAVFRRHVTLSLGLRIRLRWSDAPATTAYAESATICTPDVQRIGAGQYRFRPMHPLAGFFSYPIEDETAPTKRNGIPAIRKQLAPPYPAPLTGWTLDRAQSIELQLAGKTVESLSLHATQQGNNNCQRMRTYKALFANGQPIAISSSHVEQACSPGGDATSRSLEAHWLDDGSLARFIQSSTQDSADWDGFVASAPAAARCGSAGPAPSSEDVDALKAELQGLRAAFKPVASR